MPLDGPARERIDEAETRQQQRERLNRARRILAAYYLLLPLVLIYFLFKLFPPYPWPTNPPGSSNLVEWVQIFFIINKLNLWTTIEQRLLLLVIASGALGSYIHSATSYADYRGNQQFSPSWMLWYLVRPLVGVCLAVVIYFCVRGGLLLVILSGKEATSASNINPFGVAAIAGLTGMFSKQAADKLAEVFTTLFKSQGDESRRDSLTPSPAPTIQSVDPNEGEPAGGTLVTIKGTGFASGATSSFGENPATDVTFVNDTAMTVKTPSGNGVVDVVVTNPDGQKATASEAFTYTDVGSEKPVDGEGGDEDLIDGCDVDFKPDTMDEDLPITEGGVE